MLVPTIAWLIWNTKVSKTYFCAPNKPSWNTYVLTSISVFFLLLMNDFKLSSKSYFNNWLLTSRWLAPVTSLFDSPLKTLIFSNNHSRKKKQKGVEKWERGVNLNPHCFLLISWCFASRDGFLIVQIYLTRKHISIKIRIIAAQISFVSEISAESTSELPPPPPPSICYWVWYLKKYTHRIN